MNRTASQSSISAQAPDDKKPRAKRTRRDGKTKKAGDGDFNDKEMVARAKAGDQEAFRALFERYQRRAYALAYGVLHNPDDARDVVQEGFIKAHRYLPKFEGNSSFYTWLYRIIMN
ncbi:MAG: sigma-70 family RNA polymerase sigma factor, partial [Myxococcota bacterium]